MVNIPCVLSLSLHFAMRRHVTCHLSLLSLKLESWEYHYFPLLSMFQTMLSSNEIGVGVTLVIE